MLIRAARAEDIPAVLALWEQARSAAASTADTADAVTRLNETWDDALLVAEEDGVVVGTLVAAWDGWRGNMYRLAVLPDKRRRGIARALVEEAHARLRARGARRVTALVGEDEVVAHELWRAVGYDLDTHVVRFVRNL